MSPDTKRVFYVKHLSHNVFAELLEARPAFRLERALGVAPGRAAPAQAGA